MSINHKITAFFQRLLKATVPLPLVLIITLLSTTFGAYAASGTTDSSAAPNATSSYTLEDIYQRLNTYTLATQSTFTEPSVAPGTGTMHTLNDIYTLLDQRAFVPQTGITTCFDDTGTLISCVGTGQDGEYQMGIVPPTPRFVDNGDGTVTDNLTQLIWLQEQTCASLTGTYDEILIAATTLQDGQCGLTDGSSAGDWRYPNINELISVLGWGQESGLNQALPAPFTESIHFFGALGAVRLSSTVANSSGFVYATGNNQIWRSDRSSDYYGWAVRGGN